MDCYTRNEDTLRKSTSLPGAPILFPKYRCTHCSQPIKKKFAGPSGACWPCEYGEQDIDPLTKIDAVSIYFPQGDWGNADGKVISELIEFSREILEAKESRHTEKMVEILGFGIERMGYENFDVVMIPPSSSEPNHMRPKAHGIEQMYGIPFEDAIIKLSETKPMKTLSAKGREEVTDGNYYCQSNVEGERVILLDDIVTTTNTICGVASAVENQGASKIVTVAMTRSVDLFDLKKMNLISEK